MTVKDKVLEMFETNIGENISGEEMAKKIGVSRNAVWKAVCRLREDGYHILSSTKNGYVFLTDNDNFSAGSIRALTATECDIVMLDETASTNTVAKELAHGGANEATVIIAKKQSGGRGRMGRSFLSDSENGLYMTIILRPGISVAESTCITVIGAVATAEAIEQTSGKECKIKWVNDIFINDKKVCGILTEASADFESGSLDYAVIGIGVNIAPPKNGFPSEIKNIAGSVFCDVPNGYKAKLAAKIIDNFFGYYFNINNKSYIKTYRKKSNIIGKEVGVYRGTEVIYGTVIDIDNEAAIVVKTDEGIRKFTSGEARVRSKK